MYMYMQCCSYIYYNKSMNFEYEHLQLLIHASCISCILQQLFSFMSLNFEQRFWNSVRDFPSMLLTTL